MRAGKKEVEKACKKLGFENESAKRGRHLKYVFIRKGKRRAVVIIAKGRKEIKKKTLENIRKQMLLSRNDFSAAIQCPYKKRDYESFIDNMIEDGVN